MIYPSAAAAEQRSKLRRCMLCILAKVSESSPDKDSRKLCILLLNIVIEMKPVPMSYPFAVWAATVKVVTATFLPCAPEIRFLSRETVVAKVRIKIQNFGDLHYVQQSMAPRLSEGARYPPTRIHSGSLVI